MRFALVLLLATAAHAEPMREQMHDYFDGELRESWAFGGMGLVSLGAGAGLLASGGDLRRGMSIPLLVVGLLQLGLGVGLRVRTPCQVAALDEQLARSPGEYATHERERMRRVNRGFPIYTAVEASLFFLGVGLAGAGGIVNSDFALGAGITLALEAAAMLVLDYFAALRGARYEAALLGFRF